MWSISEFEMIHILEHRVPRSSQFLSPCTTGRVARFSTSLHIQREKQLANIQRPTIVLHFFLLRELDALITTQ